MDSSLPPKYVSPSRLARFYYLECERYLRFTSVIKDAREREGVPDPFYDTSPVTQAILETGEKWEEEVIETMLRDAVHQADAEPDTPISERIFDQARAREVISTIGPGEFVFQAELSVPKRFYRRYDLDPKVVSWTPCRPDLIECVERDDGSLQLRVIDMKASRGVKLSHRIQATVYSLILNSLVDEWELTDRTVADEGGIWLAKHNEPEYFELRSIRPPIEQFLEHELQPLMERRAPDAPWHLYYRCEWCQYFEHRREEMHATNSVSRVPYLSTHAKRYLEGAAPPIRSAISRTMIIPPSASSNTSTVTASISMPRSVARNSIRRSSPGSRAVPTTRAAISGGEESSSSGRAPSSRLDASGFGCFSRYDWAIDRRRSGGSLRSEAR
jgi:DNA replication ATP-dependent helicase/nuclease Dna2